MVALSDGQAAASALLEGPQRYTCLVGGARAGKTFLIVRAILQRALDAAGSRHALLRFHANAARASIGGETLPKVRELCFPGLHWVEKRSEGTFTLDNGSQLAIAGIDDRDRADRILGLEYATIYLNEASQIPYASALIALTRLAQVVPGLEQRAFVDLNPTSVTHWTNRLFGEKRDPLSLRPHANPAAYARAFLNPRDNAQNLTPAYLASLAELPERQRKRFYEGEYVEMFDDALWTWDGIERERCEAEMIPVDFRKAVVVGVDPSGVASKDDSGHDEVGIVVAALGQDGDGYVLADRSCRDSPLAWARCIVNAFREFSADTIVAESNFGGEMVRSNIHTVDPNVPVRMVTAARGKVVRAEPISAYYAAGKVHHVGRYPKLEDQLCAFTGAGYNGPGSPDHADAAIWALTHLFEQDSNGTGMIEHYRRLGMTSPSA